MEIQELINRGRLLFSGAPERCNVFSFVNGKRSAKDIAIKVGRPLTSTLRDLQQIRDMGLILLKKNKNGNTFRKDGSVVYEKIPEVRHLSMSYFGDSTKVPKKFQGKKLITKSMDKKIKGPVMPTENNILDICKKGEDQLYEFKQAGTEMRTFSKEICAFANTKFGGLIFYGVEDDGAITGSDKRRQQFDQSIQNSIRHTITPSVLAVDIIEKDVMRQKIMIIRIPAWDRKDVYRYEGRVYIRKGTNVFEATSDEAKKLYKGEFVV